MIPADAFMPLPQQRKDDTQKMMGDLLSQMNESIRHHVKAEVADVRMRLDRIEKLLFHADSQTFAAVDAAISAARQHHSASKLDTDLSSEGFARGRSTSRSPVEPVAKVYAKVLKSPVISATAKSRSPTKVLDLQSKRSMPAKVLDIQPKSMPAVYAKMPSTPQHHRSSGRDNSGIILPASETPSTTAASSSQNLADAVSSTQRQRQHIQPGHPQAPDDLTDLHGLWASSLGRIVVVNELGCKFDDNDVHDPLTSANGIYNVGDLESTVVSAARIDWKQHVTASTSSWHRLSRCTHGEWTRNCHRGRIGDIVQLEDNFNFVTQIDAEPIKLLGVGLCGRIAEIDPDGDWYVRFPSANVEQWVLKSNFHSVRLFRVASE